MDNKKYTALVKYLENAKVEKKEKILDDFVTFMSNKDLASDIDKQILVDSIITTIGENMPLVLGRDVHHLSMIKTLKSIGFQPENGKDLIIKNSIKGIRLKNYLSLMYEKINSNNELSELEVMHPDDIKKMTEMQSDIASIKNRVGKSDFINLSLMINSLENQIKDLSKQTNPDFETKATLLKKQLENVYARHRAYKIDLENQKSLRGSTDGKTREVADKAIEELNKKILDFENKKDLYTKDLETHYTSSFNLQYALEQKQKRYTVNLQSNLDKLDNEASEIYRLFTTIFDLDSEVYKELMDTEKVKDGYFKLDSKKQKNIPYNLDIKKIKDIIKFVYTINTNFLDRSFFTRLIAKEVE